MTDVRLDPQAVIADLDELASNSGGRFAGAKRLAWTPHWMEARSWLTSKLADLGLEPERDQAGNLWASIGGDNEGFMIVGSHIDAVPDGGWLDGVLGLMTALETVRQLSRAGARPPIGVRFVDWADEEGARFGRSLIGSSACAGTLQPDEVRDLRDADGVALADALSQCGIDLDNAPSAAGRLQGAVAYLELHIEQGPVLLDGGRLACAVSGTVGVERHLMTFTGQAAHAGSTPMRLRQDSLAAAARAALEIRESAINHRGVATVGRLHAIPGVITAVAGSTEMQLDQRHLDPDELAAMLAEARGACRERGRGVQLHRRGARCLPRGPDSIRRGAGRARADECAGSRRRRGRTDPERATARRDRDRPGRPDGDDLRPVGPANLARLDRGFA